jgi:23S rRNA (cytidine2498-2'-O)-methyltransferase
MFLFAPCQVGAETVFKAEIKRLFPLFRLSFSRPGFLTFKIPDDADEMASRIINRSVFARTVARSLGKITVTTPDNMDFNNIAAEIWSIAENHRLFVNRIHVFRRDMLPTGEKGFEPGLTPELQKLHHVLITHSPKPKFLGLHSGNAFSPALSHETVLDVAEIDSGQYFVGVHSVTDNSPIFVRYAGGVLPLVLPADAVSRAWLKFEEGLRWAEFPVEEGNCCVDIGASPGGASQVLLARGADVLGVDPAEIDPAVRNHPNFTPIRGRFNQTKKSLYKNIDWVIADMNVAPNYTLDVLEEFTQWQGNSLRGMLFTLKLFQWKSAEDLPTYIDRLQQWKFGDVQVKQLAFNRQEVMVAIRKK